MVVTSCFLSRKGVYSYDYVDCMKQFDERSLNPKEALDSKLTGEGLTDENYQHAQTVWKVFNVESMKDYQNLYNLSDVLLLADFFENFSNLCMNHHGLNSSWYFSASGLIWDATSKIKKGSTRIIKRSRHVAND